MEHVKCLIYNILCSVNFIHSANLLHRDIKPANILIDDECQVKLCDFGLSRSRAKQPYDDMKEYVLNQLNNPEMASCSKSTTHSSNTSQTTFENMFPPIINKNSKSPQSKAEVDSNKHFIGSPDRKYSCK